MKKTFQLFIAIPSILAAVAAAARLQHGTQDPKGQLRISILGGNKEYPQRETPFFALSGGPLRTPVKVPLWLAIDRDTGQLCSPSEKGIKTILLRNGLIYISQYDAQCGWQLECRILDPRSAEYTRPKACINYPTGTDFEIQPLGDSLYFVYEYLEGNGKGSLVHWSPETGTEALLEYVTTFKTVIRTKEGFFSIVSQCNPLTGKVPKQAFDKISCQDGLDSCGYCIRTQGQEFKWRWKPGAPPEMIGVVDTSH